MNDFDRRDMVGRISTLTATSDQLQAEVDRIEITIVLLAIAVGALAVVVLYVHTVGIPECVTRSNT